MPTEAERTATGVLTQQLRVRISPWVPTRHSSKAERSLDKRVTEDRYLVSGPCSCSSTVERLLYKRGVLGSTPSMNTMPVKLIRNSLRLLIERKRVRLAQQAPCPGSLEEQALPSEGSSRGFDSRLGLHARVAESVHAPVSESGVCGFESHSEHHYGEVRPTVRTPGCDPGNREFDSPTPPQFVCLSFNGRMPDSDSGDDSSNLSEQAIFRGRPTAGREFLALAILVRIQASKPSECSSKGRAPV
jgi:hypothetical protein